MAPLTRAVSQFLRCFCPLFSTFWVILWNFKAYGTYLWYGARKTPSGGWSDPHLTPKHICCLGTVEPCCESSAGNRGIKTAKEWGHRKAVTPQNFIPFLGKEMELIRWFLTSSLTSSARVVSCSTIKTLPYRKFIIFQPRTFFQNQTEHIGGMLYKTRGTWSWNWTVIWGGLTQVL